MGMALIQKMLRKLRNTRDHASACPKPGHHTGCHMESLEARVLFSADVGGMLDLDEAASGVNLVPPSVIETSLYATQDTRSTDDQNSIAVETASIEVVFVDAGVEDYDQLLADLMSQDDTERHFEVYVLDSERDGIEQISEVLADYRGLDAVHILSHGDDGSIGLGGSTLDSDALQASAGLIETWGEALTAEADLLIYGCNLAATEAGQSLVNSLGELTGADVAASDDLTGNAALGGDWALEYSTGDIEATIAVSAQAQEDWSNTLAVVAVDDSATTLVDTSVGIAVIGNDSGATAVLDYTLPAYGTITDNGDGTLT